MEIYQAIVLGIVQGLTELLPVSSSAHLKLIPWMFNWNIPESFDVALHLGTLLAITLFFFKDWLGLIKGGYDQVVKKKKSTEGKIFWYIVAVTIPTGILSLVLDKFSGYICDKFNIESIMIAIALIVLGIVLYIVDKKAPSETKYEDMTFKQSFLIGFKIWYNNDCCKSFKSRQRKCCKIFIFIINTNSISSSTCKYKRL